LPANLRKSDGTKSANSLLMICRRVDLSRGRIISELLRQEVEKTVDAKAKRALQTLLHPEMLGPRLSSSRAGERC
jgi:hypothetical protein